MYRGRLCRKYNVVLLLCLIAICVSTEHAMAVPYNESIKTFVLTSFAIERFLIIISGALFIIIFTSLFFINKLRRMNLLLETKNKQVERILAEQSDLNAELEKQKKLIERELADSERLYAILIESADDGISFYDRDNKLILTNTAFYSILGMTKEEYDSTSTEELLHPDSRNYSYEKQKSLNETGTFFTEIRLRHKAGHYIVLSTRGVQIKNDDGEVIGSLTISRDITDLKKTQQELINAKEMAEASNRLKSNFLANISHEIRTPLNSVVGFSNLMIMDDVTPEQRREYCDLINYNSEKLLQIIGDIIDLSRLESSQMEITYNETSVEEVVNEAAAEVMKNISHNSKPINLIIKNELGDISDLIFTDRMWLRRALRHLLDNAAKFTFQGEIVLSYRLIDNDIQFSVKDTGIGINNDSLANIFEQFNQEEIGHKRSFEGLGIGLTLTRHVVERLGGRISVTSQKGNGSEFIFTIPYRAAGYRQPLLISNKTTSSPEWKNIRCLIVDDNKDVVLYLTRVLIDTGVQIVTARSGIEALEKIKGDPEINMVLLDMQMPEMNGVETAREIRKIRPLLPVIAQTAYVFDDDKREVMQAGCDACLVKPIRRDDLINVMSAFTSLKQDPIK